MEFLIALVLLWEYIHIKLNNSVRAFFQTSRHLIYKFIKERVLFAQSQLSIDLKFFIQMLEINSFWNQFIYQQLLLASFHSQLAAA